MRLLICMLALSATCMAQKKNVYPEAAFPSVSDNVKVSKISKNQDTLYLVNCLLGDMIYDIWAKEKLPPNIKKPIIICVDSLNRPKPIKRGK